MKKALITGVTGQDGAYLSKFLLEKGYRVCGLIHLDNTNNLEYLGVLNEIDLESGNLTDKDKIRQIIKTFKPDEIYHLGGLTAPGESWVKVEDYTNVNVIGALNILENLKEHSPASKFFNAATSEMFGSNNENGWQTEETPFHPTNPYAVTKIYSYWMTNLYRDSYKLFCTNGILFNHESPLRDKRFVTRKISDGVAKIKLGIDDKITLGNINGKRDWGFAGDYVEVMWMILQQKKPENFIVSSGEVHTIKEFIELAFNYVEIKDWKHYIKIDPKLYRPVDLSSLYGRSGKAKKILGWEAKTGFEDLVKMMVVADLRRNRKLV